MLFSTDETQFNFSAIADEQFAGNILRKNSLLYLTMFKKKFNY
jgi:hypothetical protein